MPSLPPKPRREAQRAAPADEPSGPDGQSAPEVAELQARVQHLEQTLLEMRQRHLADLKALRQSQHLLNAILDNTTALVFAKDASGRFVLINRRYEMFLNRTRAEVLGKTNYDLLPLEIAEKITQEDRQILTSGEPMEYEDQIPDYTGLVHTFLTIKFPLTDAVGAITGLCGVATDITERKRAAEERTTLQQQVIETQRAALRELSTPLIPLADGVLVVPLIGAIDTPRAQQIMEALLEGVTAQRAHTVIVDITGVRVVDAQVARGLSQAAVATRLLGAHIILTGLRAEVAQALVQSGSDLSKDVVTLSTLQAGIAHALRRTGRNRTPSGS
jgi:rsbT co-antagonist protein RsbR